MEAFCEYCHCRIREPGKMIIEDGYAFCGEACFIRAVVMFEEDVRASIRRARVQKELMGAEDAPRPGSATLAKGDAGRPTMIIAAMHERRGDFPKAITCWKKIALLHWDNLALRQRAMRRIKDLKAKGSVKCHSESGM
ncbi:hypothetical protein J7M28_04395 [bacterium]|nr:hypothetical protein [bacterium]